MEKIGPSVSFSAVLGEGMAEKVKAHIFQEKLERTAANYFRRQR